MKSRLSAPGYDIFKGIVTFALIASAGLLIRQLPPAETPTPTLPPVSVEVPSTEITTEVPTTSPAEMAVTPPAVTSTETTPTTGAAATSVDCPTSVVSRLKVGISARVVSDLYMREEPLIFSTILLTNPTGTRLEVIGGPVCTVTKENRAYLWWQVQRADGRQGWSAEAMLILPQYLLAPIE